MNRAPEFAAWIVGLSVIAIVFLFLRRMERLVTERGSIFRHTRPGECYSFPLLLGLLILGFSTASWIVGVQLYLFFAAGMTLVLYGIGFKDPLVHLQGGNFYSQEEFGDPDDIPGYEPSDQRIARTTHLDRKEGVLK